MKKLKINKILIANRGEIAVRIARTCREMGITTVAVYSNADRTAMHTRLADEAYHLGPAPAKDSYLRQELLIDIAQRCGAQAIHPGYGFLSENSTFAERVEQAGLIFVGPPAPAIAMMGDKTQARAAMLQSGVPIVPGSPEPLQSPEAAAAVAGEIGYPILLKAAAGGGGKGMRIVHTPEEIASGFRAAASEAESAFGDGRIYIEKYLQEPRHVEFQILADQHGHVIHLGERECSIQRRHQKVIEESPSVIVTEKMRQEMGAAAVKAAAACGYTNAGTVEFLVDKDRRFYFLEMNTRLQVEHPVTEMVTGLDLVRLQLEIAAGEPLSLRQEDVRFSGHAIECRIYAEDPENNFMPSTGELLAICKPDGPGTRDDSGVSAGDEISIFYDPMIAKLVVHAANREYAVARMLRALDEYKILGVKTTIPFCKWVLQHPKFCAGEFDTHFVENEYLNNRAAGAPEVDEIVHAAAIAAALKYEQDGSAPGNSTVPAAAPENSGWRLRGWKLQQWAK